MASYLERGSKWYGIKIKWDSFERTLLWYGMNGKGHYKILSCNTKQTTLVGRHKKRDNFYLLISIWSESHTSYELVLFLKILYMNLY